MVAKREAHSGNPLQGAFGSCAHRTGVEGVHARIVAVIDARHHQIGRATAHRQKDVEGEFHAIDGATGASENFQSFFAVHQAVMDGRGRSDGASVARTSTARCHDEQIGHRMERIDQCVDARGLITVIVGDEDKGTRHATIIGFCHNECLLLC